MNKLPKFSLVFLGLAVVLIFTSSVLAATPAPQAATRSGQAQNRSCAAREAALKHRSENLIQLAQRMEDTFDSIGTRVENYYNDTVIISGKSVDNYNSLVSTIGEKKMKVDADLASASATLATFSCSSGNPKEAMTNFRKNMQAVKADLAEFRSSIKNLIVAVHQVTGADK